MSASSVGYQQQQRNRGPGGSRRVCGCHFSSSHFTTTQQPLVARQQPWGVGQQQQQQLGLNVPTRQLVLHVAAAAGQQQQAATMPQSGASGLAVCLHGCASSRPTPMLTYTYMLTAHSSRTMPHPVQHLLQHSTLSPLLLAYSTHTTHNTQAGGNMQGQVDPDYLSAAAYLAEVGFANKTEIARVLDIAMNPNSLFVQVRCGEVGRSSCLCFNFLQLCSCVMTL